MPDTKLTLSQMAEMIEKTGYSIEQLAHVCGVSQDWIVSHVEAGVLHVDANNSILQFDCATIIRARRIAHLEKSFDADPQLAALTTDLIEEVTYLRKRLKTFGEH